MPHTTQALEFRRIDKRDQQPTLGRVGLDPDYVMNRITVDSLGQKCAPTSLPSDVLILFHFIVVFNRDPRIDSL